MSEVTGNEKYIGCLLGGAIGDALGAPIEFMSIDEIRQHYGNNGIEGYVEYPDGSGEFTDDTQMTLFTAEGLLRAYHREVLKGIGGATTAVTYQSYIRWLFTQGFKPNAELNGWGVQDLEHGWLIKEKDLFKQRGPGNTCLQSLQSGIPGTIEKPKNNSKGCGGIMRMAPVGLIRIDPEFAFNTGCELAALTHGHPTGYLSAGIFASIIQQLAFGINLRDSINNSMDLLKSWSDHDETMNAIRKALVLHDSMKKLDERDVQEVQKSIERLGRGWVAEEALAIALFCSLTFEDDFKKGVLAAVNHSGDSDSTGSITGNILGLINGVESIPEEWVNKLKSANIVRQIADDLQAGCKGNTDEPDDEWWERYPGY